MSHAMANVGRLGLLFASMLALASLGACGDSGNGEGSDDAGSSAAGMDATGGSGGSGGGGTGSTDGCEPPLVEGPSGRCFMPIPCPDDLPEFKLGLEAEGDDGLYTAVVFDADPSPPRKFLNDWVVDFVDASGDPATDITIDKIRAFMPAHGHDGGRAVVVEAGDADGRFSLGDINMFMAGPWELQIDVTGADGSDYIVFDTCIED